MSLKTILTVALLALFGFWVLFTFPVTVFSIVVATTALVLALVVVLER